MDLNKKIFIRLGIYVGILLTLFFIVNQILHPEMSNICISNISSNRRNISYCLIF